MTLPGGGSVTDEADQINRVLTRQVVQMARDLAAKTRALEERLFADPQRRDGEEDHDGDA